MPAEPQELRGERVRTTTIYNACEAAEHIWNPHGIDHGDVYPNQRIDRAERQCRKFYAELLFRMGQRDELVAEKNERIARLNAVAAAVAA